MAGHPVDTYPGMSSILQDVQSMSSLVNVQWTCCLAGTGHATGHQLDTNQCPVDKTDAKSGQLSTGCALDVQYVCWMSTGFPKAKWGSVKYSTIPPISVNASSAIEIYDKPREGVDRGEEVAGTAFNVLRKDLEVIRKQFLHLERRQN